MILHEIFRVVSRFPRYISCYIAEYWIPLGHCSVADQHLFIFKDLEVPGSRSGFFLRPTEAYCIGFYHFICHLPPLRPRTVGRPWAEIRTRKIQIFGWWGSRLLNFFYEKRNFENIIWIKNFFCKNKLQKLILVELLQKLTKFQQIFKKLKKDTFYIFVVVSIIFCST